MQTDRNQIGTLALMLDRLLAPAKPPQRRGERRAGAHVRPRFEVYNELESDQPR